LPVLVAVAVWLPAAQVKEDNGRGSTDGLLAKLSQGAAIGYLRAHTDQAPPEFAERLQAAEQLASQRSVASLRTSEQGRILAGVGVRSTATTWGCRRTRSPSPPAAKARCWTGRTTTAALSTPRATSRGGTSRPTAVSHSTTRASCPRSGRRDRPSSPAAIRWPSGAGLLALHGRPELRSGLPPQWHRRLQERPRNARGLPGRDHGLVLAVA
jgi:hypothetical protein